MHDFQIEKMTEAHIDGVTAIEQLVFSMPWSKQGFLDVVARDDVLFLVALQDGQVIGYCGAYLALDEAEITNVAVHPNSRKLHVGSSLLQEFESQLCARQIATILLEVRVSNAPAIGLYEKQGYQNIGVRKNFYEKPVEDAYIMSKSICQPFPFETDLGV